MVKHQTMPVHVPVPKANEKHLEETTRNKINHCKVETSGFVSTLTTPSGGLFRKLVKGQLSVFRSSPLKYFININKPLLLFKKVKDNIIRTQFINTWRRHRVQWHPNSIYAWGPVHAANKLVPILQRENDTENNKQPHHHHHHHQQQRRRHLISIIGS
uniref:Uncharacterized protein n=1 Tax=Glossina austeni TaxID=7395 RepID=A0A1A9UYV0_GLOAU